jgi:hypothetical protein
LEHPDRCRTAVIKHDNGAEQLKFKIHSVTKENIDMWDLALFTTPRHPGFNKLKSGDTKYLKLDFATAAEREDFVLAFNDRIRSYWEELNAYKTFRAQRDYMSNHPESAPSPPGLHSPRSSSIVSTEPSRTVRTPTSLASGLPTLALELNFSALSFSE